MAVAANDFTAKHFHCLGGRLGSGMGALLEALWAFNSRSQLEARLPGAYEIAWLVDNEYNDFAVVDAARPWDPPARAGEILRIEAKCMNLDADETKGHFDALQSQIGADDLLLVAVWRWITLKDQVVFPRILDQFLGSALEVARLRDALHLARGGSFVAPNSCPDGCPPEACKHSGEPLNASGFRERRGGPTNTRPSAQTPYAANFGGLKRMISTRSPEARAELERQMRFPVRKHYVDFIKSFPALRQM